MPRASFRDQVGGNRLTQESTDEDKMKLAAEIDTAMEDVVAPFESKFAPSDMRQLALVAHNHMKPAMKEFIETYSELLKKFRITGTQTTMRMCKALWGEDDPDIEYGLTCTSGPLGGDAQIAALMCMEDLGALIFFVDPLSAHPHQADIDSLIRLANCGNVIVCPNPTSAMSMMHTLKCALEKGSRGMIPSFFQTLESPAVAEYKRQQELALAAAVNSGSSAARPPLMGDPSMHMEVQDTEDGFSSDDDDDEDEDHGEGGDEVYELASIGSRPSTLYGITPKKKRKGLIKKISKSIKKLGSSVH
eukprot:CAMPEP_0183785312 /NCGR_PEP_ID=MMETSP0739-20130205/66437_1 /TAXON_ID=385413 /ORGANISM="Thalassiosira miniscula, Strain CCMP1093" /LENGTH=303 /DNA_ID=CAMNT_0026029313 /DNA_START=202 /DNA_END=1113 /DNA_ORIENTATION=+